MLNAGRILEICKISFNYLICIAVYDAGRISVHGPIVRFIHKIAMRVYFHCTIGIAGYVSVGQPFDGTVSEKLFGVENVV